MHRTTRKPGLAASGLRETQGFSSDVHNQKIVRVRIVLKARFA
jgi:hypothetical protein